MKSKYKHLHSILCKFFSQPDFSPIFLKLVREGFTHVIKRRQNALSKNVADHFQGFCHE